jgi:O-antigen/teichoic acid export membrane protein
LSRFLSMWKTSVYNLTLRSLTLVSKFILVLFIARYLSPEELGIYGLVSVTIVMAIYFLGMDFYTYNTREILAGAEADQARLVRDQLAFHGVVYLAVLPVLLLVFIGGFLPWRYIGWFYVLLVLEHLSQESHRLFLILSRSVIANMILFLRSGAWVYAVLALIYFKADTKSLTTIWSGWIIGVSLSLALSVYFLRTLDWRKARRSPIDWQWIRRGLKKSLIFFGASMTMQAVQFAERYIVKYFNGEAMVGVYTFFANIANVIPTFIFTGIIAILYPKIVSAFQKGKHDEYRELMRKMGTGVISGALILSVIAVISVRPVLNVVGKSIYNDHLAIFWIMIMSVSIMITSFIPYYGLYVRRLDRYILISTVTAVGVGLIFNLLLTPIFGIIGTATSTLIGYSLLLILNIGFLRKKVV